MDKKKIENTVVDEILTQAFREAAEKEFETIEPVSPEDILTEHQMKIERRAYETYERSKQKKRISTNALKTVACFIIAIVAVSVLLFSVPTVRAGFLQLINRVFSEYTLIETDGKSEEGIIIFKSYMLNYIPEGFIVDENNKTNQRSFAFVSTNGQFDFNIKRYSNNSFSIQYDNDGSIIEDMKINGYSGYYCYTENENKSLLSWSDEYNTFVISGNIPKEELIKIAENMKYLIE